MLSGYAESDRCNGYEDEGKQTNRLQNTTSDTQLICKREYRWYGMETLPGNADASTSSFLTVFFFFERSLF